MRVSSSDGTKDLPNTYSRSTTETIMNPISQNIPVICLHLKDTTNTEVFFLNAVDKLLSKRRFFHAPELLLFENHEERAVSILSYR